MNSKKIILCVSIMLTCFLIAFIFHCYSANVSGHSLSTRLNKVEKRVSSKKIQDIRVGDRTTGKNPEVSEAERRSFLPEPTPASWKTAVLEMQKSDGSRLDLTLLRPLEWFELADAKIGEQVFIDLPEMGVRGNAKLLAVGPCPTIKPGDGNVVTGTFRHQANGTIDLFVDALDKPIGCTDTHPFWSVSREEFIDAGKLRLGEELRLRDGQITRVTQIQSRSGSQFVYNIEVLNEHVYEVTWLGILVHNACDKFHANRDANNGNRISDVDATVKPENLRTGSQPTAGARRQVNENSIDDAGHIVAKVLGGSGSDLDNIVSLGRTLNRGQMATFEKRLAHTIETTGATAKIKIEFEYADSNNPTRPTTVYYSVTFEGPLSPGQLMPDNIVKHPFENPIQTQ